MTIPFKNRYFLQHAVQGDCPEINVHNKHARLKKGKVNTCFVAGRQSLVWQANAEVKGITFLSNTRSMYNRSTGGNLTFTPRHQ